VFLSTNNGAIWTRVSTGLTDTSVLSLAYLGTNLFAGMYYSRGGGVFRSTNNGTSWSPANTGLPYDSVNGYYPGVMAFSVSGTNLFAGTYGRGVFLSTNNGTNWALVNTGMTDDEVSTLAVGSTYLFAGTGADDMGGSYGTGVWKRPLSEMITSVPPAVQLPREFVLEQNYPNPFNPSSVIRFALPHASFVTLTVYNTLGQQVGQLVNEQQQAGYHDVVFRGDGLASGVYFYRIQAGDFIASKKLLFLK
jgi:hypothetical protein